MGRGLVLVQATPVAAWHRPRVLLQPAVGAVATAVAVFDGDGEPTDSERGELRARGGMVIGGDDRGRITTRSPERK